MKKVLRNVPALETACANVVHSKQNAKNLTGGKENDDLQNTMRSLSLQAIGLRF